MNEDLKGYNWENLLENTGTDETFQILHGTLLECMNKHMPIITRKQTKTDHCSEPWITKGIEKSSNRQKQLYRKSISNKSTEKDLNKYKEYRSMLQRIKRKAKMNYYQGKCKEYKNETRKLWTVINTITGKKRNRENMIESLKIGNLITNDAKKITITFCKFFPNVGKEYANLIPRGNHSIGHYLDKIPQNKQTMFMTPTSKLQ